MKHTSQALYAIGVLMLSLFLSSLFGGCRSAPRPTQVVQCKLLVDHEGIQKELDALLPLRILVNEDGNTDTYYDAESNTGYLNVSDVDITATDVIQLLLDASHEQPRVR